MSVRITQKPELDQFDKVKILASDVSGSSLGSDKCTDGYGVAKIVSNKMIYEVSCSTASSTTAKAIAIPAIRTLIPGLTIAITFSNGNSAANPTLSINSGSAVPIKFRGLAVPALGLEKNRKYLIQYIGSSWEILNSIEVPRASGLVGRSLLDVFGTGSLKEVFKGLKDCGSRRDYKYLSEADWVDINEINGGASLGILKNASRNLRTRIAGFGTYDGVGDTEVGGGILMEFENCICTRGMNPLRDGSTHFNDGGYPACELKRILNEEFAPGLAAAIGVTPKTVRRLLDTHGNWSWTPETVFLPTEIEVFGHQAWGRGDYYTGTSIQWPIYARDPSKRIKRYNGSRMWWWEATSYSGNTTCFCIASYNGGAYYNHAGYSGGVSPAFYIG